MNYKQLSFKKILLSYFFTILSLNCFSQNALNIHQKDGTLISYVFAEKPKVSFADNKLVVTTSKTIVEFLISDVDKFTFEDIKTSIEDDEIKVANACLEYWEVYTLGGKLVKKVKIIDDSNPMENLPKGIYIIKCGNVSYKIIKH